MRVGEGVQSAMEALREMDAREISALSKQVRRASYGSVVCGGEV